MRRSSACSVALLTFVVASELLWAPVAAADKKSDTATASASSLESLAQGQKVFEANCVACHGIHGDGKGPAAAAISGKKPRDFTKGVFQYGSRPEEILKTISTGVKDTAMPSWSSLSFEDRKAVVQYVLSLKK